MFFKIPRCYDSHLHLLALGQIAESLDLSGLTTATEIDQLKAQAHHFSGEWLLGFGWDQNKWPEKIFPACDLLDQVFPHHPVAFTRADGHALWVNSLALKKANISGSGILIDQEMNAIQKLIPPFSYQQKKRFILAAQKILNRAGFTHIRDMSGDPEQWMILNELEQSGELSLYIEQNVYLDSMQNLNSVLRFAQDAKKNQTQHLRISAIKYFYDGALGSEGALLSQNYLQKNHHGLRLSSINEMKDLFRICWEKEFPVAVHVIGDQAAHEVTQAAWHVWQSGLTGELHLEHGQLIRPETIQMLAMMKTTVHMQPCHWLSDSAWLENKIGNLIKYAFPWNNFAENKISVFWGSDAPIEKPSVWNNLQALKESAKKGIPEFPLDHLLPHTHPDSSWGRDCFSQFTSESENPVVTFDGKRISF